MKIFNSIVGTRVPDDETNRGIRYKAICMFAYKWDKVGGGFPNFQTLMKQTSLYFTGDKTFSIEESKCMKADFRQFQVNWFETSEHLIDLNEETGIPIMKTSEVFWHLYKKNIVDKDLILNSGKFYSLLFDYDINKFLLIKGEE